MLRPSRCLDATTDESLRLRSAKAVSERILASPTWTKARAVGIYVGTKGEVDTDTMCRAALRQGECERDGQASCAKKAAISLKRVL